MKRYKKWVSWRMLACRDLDGETQAIAALGGNFLMGLPQPLVEGQNCYAGVGAGDKDLQEL